jgi:hypothetical protein
MCDSRFQHNKKCQPEWSKITPLPKDFAKINVKFGLSFTPRILNVGIRLQTLLI